MYSRIEFIMNTNKERIKELIESNPNTSNTELARMARSQGVNLSERQLRRVASGLKREMGIEPHPDGVRSNINVDVCSSHPSDTNRKTQEVKGDITNLSYTGTKSLTSLEEALEFFEVDTSVWDVESWIANSWDSGDKTNYQVKIRLKKIVPDEFDSEFMDNLLDEFKKASSKVKTKKVKGSGIGVAVVSDFHIGAKVTDMMQTDDFGYDVVVDRLNQAAEQINRQKYKEVQVALLGDFIETFTGLNHMDCWQGIEYGGYGANVLIVAYEIIKDFLSKINNISTVSIVSGNHDRISVKSDVDSHGGVAQILAYMFEQSGLKVNFSHSVVSSNIDGMRYIFTHNHLGLAKKDMVQTFWEYGEQGVYNLLLGGHFHSRSGKAQYKKLDSIHWDQANYRSISVAPIFTGNWYSESNGWSSTSGITIVENNGDGKPNVFDFTLR